MKARYTLKARKCFGKKLSEDHEISASETVYGADVMIYDKTVTVDGLLLNYQDREYWPRACEERLDVRRWSRLPGELIPPSQYCFYERCAAAVLTRKTVISNDFTGVYRPGPTCQNISCYVN